MNENTRMPSLPALLSFNGGYVDTAGFLALQGLFTAHVTGNFVTIGAALVFGKSGLAAKLLALPVFCSVVLGTRFISVSFDRPARSALNAMLTVKIGLLILAAVLAFIWGPFESGDGWRAVITGMTLVAAMAIQNAAHRIHLGNAPPTTLMTGTTTQLMIDLADSLHGLPAQTSVATHLRMRRMAGSILSFALGAAVAAMIFRLAGAWCFVLPPIVALWARLVSPSSTHPASSPPPPVPA